MHHVVGLLRRQKVSIKQQWQQWQHRARWVNLHWQSHHAIAWWDRAPRLVQDTACLSAQRIFGSMSDPSKSDPGASSSAVATPGGEEHDDVTDDLAQGGQGANASHLTSCTTPSSASSPLAPYELSQAREETAKALGGILRDKSDRSQVTKLVQYVLVRKDLHRVRRHTMHD